MLKPEDSLLRKTIRISTLEGIFAQIYTSLTGIGSVFITKFAVILQAQPIHFSLLTAISQISQVFQIMGYAVTRNSIHRKEATLRFVGAGRFLTAFLGLSVFLFPPGSGIWLFLIILFLSSSLNAIGGNIWIAWISDLIPLRYRGRFFSRRAQYLVGISLLVSYLLSLFIDLFESESGTWKQKLIEFFQATDLFRPEKQVIFLALIFVLGSLISLLGLLILAKQPEKSKSIEQHGIIKTIKTAFNDQNFRKLLIFSCWWMMAVGIGSPFWGPFMMTKLKMTLLEMQIYGSFSALISIFSFRWWGRFIDKYGNRNAMKIAILLGGFNPQLWLLMHPYNYHVIWLEAISTGFMWAGAGVVATNFVLSVAPAEKHQIYSGIYGAFAGLGMMITALLSSQLLITDWQAGAIHWEAEQLLFSLGGIMRWTAIIPLLWIKEPRRMNLGLTTWLWNQAMKIRIIQIRDWMFGKNSIKKGFKSGQNNHRD